MHPSSQKRSSAFHRPSALHRMEQNGWIKSAWAPTESGRKARYYRLTAAGRKELQAAEKSFDQLVKGVRAVMRYA